MQLLANTLKQILSYLAPAFFLTLAGLAHGDALFNVAEIAPVLDKHPCKTTCKVQENASDYTLTPVDLNGDGRYEYLVKSEADCGSGGCAQGLFIRGNTGWVKLVENQGDMKVTNRRTNGFSDIVVSGFAYTPSKHQVRRTYRWDGRQYQAR